MPTDAHNLLIVVVLAIISAGLLVMAHYNPEIRKEALTMVGGIITGLYALARPNQ